MRARRLVIALLLGLLAVGCVPPPAQPAQPIQPAEPVTFSVLFNNSEIAPFRPDWLILEEYKRRQNVSLDVRLGADSDYEKAVVQALESGDPPDIILKVWPKPIESYANAGVLLPISDYVDQMPYFQAYIEQNNLQGELDKLRLANGKYYLLPGYQRRIQVQQWIYRRDLFEAHQIPTPTTYDELFAALVKLKELYPESTPLSTLWGGAHLFAMMGAGYGIPAGWAGVSAYNAAEDRWEYAPATENYRAMYSFLRRSYDAGILDPELFTQSDDKFYAKLQDGRAFVTVTWITSGFANWNNALHENGFPDAEWASLPVPASTIGIRALPAVDPFRKGLAISSRVADDPRLPALLSFLDWAIYSDEGRTLTVWGVEGLTYENTADGKVFLPHIKTTKNPDGTLDVAAEYGFNQMFNLVENEEFEDYKKPDEIVAFLDRSLAANETAELSPQLTLDAQSIEVIRLINERLSPYVARTSMQFITGELDIDQDWDAYLAELEQLGARTIVDIWNTAWQKQRS